MGKENKWQEELAVLKSIIAKTELKETVKWSAPVYTHHGKNVLGMVGFKNFFSLWFYNGVFLKDEQQVLVSADEKTKALRQWRFTSKDEINEKVLLKYIREAIRNEEEGKVWKPKKSEPLETSGVLLEALKKNKRLKTAFEKLKPYKQREYIEHVNSAKREETKKTRLEKITSMILQGVGLHDQYK